MQGQFQEGLFISHTFFAKSWTTLRIAVKINMKAIIPMIHQDGATIINNKKRRSRLRERRFCEVMIICGVACLRYGVCRQ